MISSTLIVIKIGCKRGVVNRNGDYILPCQYDEIIVFDKRIVAIKSDTNYEFNLSGDFIKILNEEYS